jgi:hypothetical protein
MSTTATILRRTALLALLALTVVATIVSVRRRRDRTGPVAAPQWPEFDEIEVGATAATTTWVPAAGDDVVPHGFPVKVKLSSGIFHVPGGRFYERTKADRWYATTGAAEADGYRRSKT